MKKLLLLFSLGFMMSLSKAQTLPSQCSAFKPAILDKTTIFSADVKTLASTGYGQNGTKTNKHWDVYSDRCNNALYKTANTSSPTGKTLRFNQKVRIAKIESGFALVYIEKKPGSVQFPYMSEEVECLGWIPMDNLLLWDSCPTNEYGIYRKALIVQNIDMSSDESFGYISQHPDPKNKTNREELHSSIDFHYIMKEVGSSANTRYLLAKYNKLDGIVEMLEGWVSQSSFTPWNQRSCLEPNWDPEVVSFFKDNQIKAPLYENKSMTGVKPQEWEFGKTENEFKSVQPSTRYRMPPYTMRFPILDNDAPDKENSFKLTAFGTPNGDMASMAIDINKGKKGQESALENASHINVIVVIDGTRSMGKYFASVSKALQQANDFLQKNGNEKVKVGAVIYRDYADGENNVIEYQKMTDPGDSKFSTFLTNIGRNNYGASSSTDDKTDTEAMYLGLYTALDHEKLGYSPSNSNLVFVIGDCGNDPKDTRITKEQIIKRAIDCNAQLFSFQVQNKDKDAWKYFNDQLEDIFTAVIKYQYTDKVTIGWRPNKAKNGFRIVTNSAEHFYYSERHRSGNGTQLPESELVSLIQESFERFRASIQEQWEAIANTGRSITGSHKEGQVSINEEFLRRKLGANYNSVIEANSMLAYTGYTKRAYDSQRDYWNAVVVLSTEELTALVAKLQPLKTASKSNSYSDDDRKKYVDAIAALIQSMTEKSATEIMAMNTEEVTRIIGGLNVSTPMLRGNQNKKVYTLSEIKNRNACPDSEFKNILKSMSNKIEDLTNLSGNKNFKYVFEQNGKKSYWLPLEMLP